MKTLAALEIVIGMLFPASCITAAAFVSPAPFSKGSSSGTGWATPKKWTGAKTSLSYGSREDGDEEKDLAAPSPPFSASDFQERLGDALDPACSVDDEDCLAFSSLDHGLPPFDSNASEDPLCDPQDVDCRAFLPGSRLDRDSSLAAELQSRSDSIEKERIDRNWKAARCPTTFVPVSDSDWVRRVDVDSYPLAACGGARGGVYVVDLEEKAVVAKAEGAHAIQVEQGATTARRAMEHLHGRLDGGGVVAVAIRGDLVASSGREGGVRLWRIVRSHGVAAEGGTSGGYSRGTLVPLGILPGLQNTIVTSLKFDSNRHLWVACYDGTVRAYNMTGYNNSAVRFPPKKPAFRSDFTDSVLDMYLCEKLQLGVCATADGSAALFNLVDGQFFVGIMLFEVAARSVLIVNHKNDSGYSVMCGGTDGTIHRIPLNINPKNGRVYEDNPFAVSDTTDTAIKPRHVGPVMTMACPDDGMFVSGGQDGAIRVWDCSPIKETANDAVGQEAKPQKLQTKCMYALTGYKLWLSACTTDGKRLVSDGGESSVIIRDFSREPGTNGKASL
ncbi:hypothetical protein ACHAWF_011080 [Thalassiosira exigua]